MSWEGTVGGRLPARVLAKAEEHLERYEQSLLLRRLSSCSHSRNSDWPVNQHYAVATEFPSLAAAFPGIT